MVWFQPFDDPVALASELHQCFLALCPLSLVDFNRISLIGLLEWVGIGYFSSPDRGFQLSGKESACQCRSYRFKPWVRKIPWSRK